MRTFRQWSKSVLLVSIVACGVPPLAQAQGLILPGAGAPHMAMGGASTAMGVDALGALYWNPAAIGGLPWSEVAIGGQAIIADSHVGSTIPAGAFGPLGPATTQTGYSRSDSGVGLASDVGIVYRQYDSPFSAGLGIMTLAGGGVNYPGNPSNPVLAPTGPLQQFVLGAQAGSLAVVSIMPTMACQITDQLAVGVSPMLDVSVVSFDPAFFGPPSSPSSPLPPPFGSAASFPTGSHTRPFWGGGFRMGTTYRVTPQFTAGFSYTSPQWFETWQFNARTADGDPLNFQAQFSLPQIFSAGLAFTGFERLLLAADVRWLDYSTTQLMGEPVRDGGAGWHSVWAVALGARYQLTQQAAVQLGYLFNDNPVPGNLALFNTMLPGIIEHTLAAGVSYQLNDYMALSMAYVHGFKNSVTGSVFPLLGTSTTLDAEYDALAFGLQIRFGGCQCSRQGRTCDQAANR